MPIIRTSFSADLTVLRRFLDANQKAIETLTLADAVFGEIENLVLEVDQPADILAIEPSPSMSTRSTGRSRAPGG